MMTIDDYVYRRNALQFVAENTSEAAADAMWKRLGVANRHIDRVISGVLSLTPAVADEIERCLEAAAK